MRVSEIILESAEIVDEVIEDEAESRGDSVLITALEWLRNEAEQSNAVTPRVKVDTIINQVRNIPGNEAFNFSALDAAYTHNDSVKSLIKDIKDDEKTGTKYVYLAPPESELDSSDPLGAEVAAPGDPAKVVSSMAKRAASK
jgi:hypothetical protein